MANAEHPLTLTEATATLQVVSDRISREAFDGANVRLLNSKNLPIPDVDGTRGVCVCVCVCVASFPDSTPQLFIALCDKSWGVWERGCVCVCVCVL